MPVRQFKPRNSPQYQQLVSALTREWQHPNATLGEPVIVEELDSNGSLDHVYVIWSDWNQLDGAERSRVIMDAAEARYGRSGTASVTIAMGLTPSEADRMQIDWH